MMHTKRSYCDALCHFNYKLEKSEMTKLLQIYLANKSKD